MAVKRLTDEELVAMLELARKADSVELKLTVPAADHRMAIAGLGLDPLEAQIRQVFFFDTPELALNAVGVVARARRIQGRAGDTVVKLRPVDPEGLPAELRQSPHVGVEVADQPQAPPLGFGGGGALVVVGSSVGGGGAGSVVGGGVVVVGGKEIVIVGSLVWADAPGTQIEREAANAARTIVAPSARPERRRRSGSRTSLP